jgi:outer membrane protein insertion porin family
MRTFLILAVLFVSIALQAKTLGTLTVEGLNSKATKAVKEVIQPFVNDTFSLDDLHKAVAAVYAMGSFNEIEVYTEETGSGTNVTFRVLPVRTVKSLSFTGNKSFGDGDLRSELGFSDSEAYSQEKIKSGVESVKKFYNLNGFLNAEVSADIQPSDNGTDLNIKVRIVEKQPCVIEAISFESVNKTLNRALERRFARTISKRFSQSLLNTIQSEATEYLFGEKYLSSQLLPPEITYDALRTKVSLRYVINDPYVYALLFEGNSTYTSAKILKELRLESGDRLSTSPVDDLTERLLRFYRKNGYANVTVKYKENLFTQDNVRRIIFTIDEGQRVRIKDIVIDGIFSKPPVYYRRFIFEHSGDLVEKKYYNSEDIETGLKNLVIDLQNQGYISAKIVGTRIDYEKNLESVVIKVTLDEGPQTSIERITFKGIKNVSQSQLEEVIGLTANRPLQLNTLEESSNRIVELYRSKGFLDAIVANQGKSIISYSADNTKATLTFEIDEGPLVTVSSVVVEGNVATKDYVVTRELQFKPGEVLTPDKIGYSEQRLQRLSIFSSIDIHTLEDDPNQGNRTVLVRVAEQNPGIFKSGVGVNNELNLSLKGFVGAAYRNLFGTGRGLNARLETNYKVQYKFLESDINLGYTEPFVFGTQNTGRLNLTKSVELVGIDKSPEKGYAVDTTQIDLLLERDFTRQLKMVYSVYGFAHTNNYQVFGPDPREEQKLDIASTGPTFLYDRRDNVFNPSRGYLWSLALEYADPLLGGTDTVNYGRAVGSYTRYIPIGRLVWANEGKAGYLKNVSGLPDSAVPKIKAFVLGGRSTIRGFDSVAESFPQPKHILQGIEVDSYFVLAKSELRFPVYGNLGGAVFYDGGRVSFSGNVTGNERYNPQFSWRDSLGLGIRYNTPVGPVSLEYGLKLNRDEQTGEAPGAWHFSIGVF